MTLEELAQDFSRRFEGATRDDGPKYRRVKDDQETDELKELIYDAHGDMLPDDHRYAMIEDALEAIAEDGEDAQLEPSIYTHELTAWLASRNDRFAYCDEWMAEYGTPESTIQLLQGGMALEQQEVLSSVLNSLQKIVEALDEAA